VAKKKARKPPGLLESELEAWFLREWLKRCKNRPVLQYKFHHYRQFRFDFAWPTKKVAVEVQGIGPGHCSLKGMNSDYEKHMEAIKLNWKVVYITKTFLSPTKIDRTMEDIASLLDLKARPILQFRRSH
jgi:very-short-patch-repair endonuclease